MGIQDISECNEVLFGDINNDGLINILDVVNVVNDILSSIHNEYADLNFDGIINILDIIHLVNIVLDN